MRFFIGLFLLLFFFSYPVFAQRESVVDSLQELLIKTKVDTTRVNLLSELAFELGYNDNARGVDSARKALALAREIGFEKGIYAAQGLLGRLLFERGDLDSAMVFYNLVLPYFEKRNKKNALRNLYKNIGLVHQERQSFDNAFNYYQNHS